MKKSLWYYKTKIGMVGIAGDEQGITHVFLKGKAAEPETIMERTPLLEQTAGELEEYLDGRRREFEIKLHLEGTAFQKKVWEALCAIPYGETRSYKEIAENIGNPKACRAVGMANNRNPIMILVPCHRVIGADGSLVGYGGGLKLKKFLLNLERTSKGKSDRDTLQEQVIQEETIQKDDIRQELEELAEPEFQKFASSLIPNVPKEKILGVRLPEIRKLAKKLAKGDWQQYLAQAKSDCYEEILLRGILIGKIQAPLPKMLEYIREFVPKIDNWSTCDSFCAGLKLAKTYPKEIWDFIQPYFQSEEEYQVRFAVVMLLDYYVEEAYREAALQLLERVRHEGYYVKMAVAWAVSKFCIRFPESVTEFLQKSDLDDFTYNKALQKILESRAVSAEKKEEIRRMKRGRIV